jgi:hypothetical protein
MPAFREDPVSISHPPDLNFDVSTIWTRRVGDFTLSAPVPLMELLREPFIADLNGIATAGGFFRGPSFGSTPLAMGPELTDSATLEGVEMRCDSEGREASFGGVVLLGLAAELFEVATD